MMTCKYCSKPCYKCGKQKNGRQKYRCKKCLKYQQAPVDLGSDHPFSAIIRNLQKINRLHQKDPSRDFYLEDIIDVNTSFEDISNGSMIPVTSSKFIFKDGTKVDITITFRTQMQESKYGGRVRAYARRFGDNRIDGIDWSGSLRGSKLTHDIRVSNGDGSGIIQITMTDDKHVLEILRRIASKEVYLNASSEIKRMRNR